MSIKKVFEKIKSVKNIELYVALVLGVVVLAIVLLMQSSKVDKTVKDNAQFDEYISYMENKITSVIQKIDGVDKVKVAISHSAESETVYAYETVSTTTGNTTNQKTDIVTVNGKPLVVKTLPPEIYGVVVIADGADDVATKVKIIQTVVTLLDVQADRVQVFTYKS